MKKCSYTLLGITGFLLILTTEVSAASVLSKISTMVIIFTSLAGAAIWIYAIRKRREFDE